MIQHSFPTRRSSDLVLEPQRRLAEICSAESIPFLDLAPAFEAHARVPGADPLFRDKVHLTPVGHALVERVLRERLLETGWLPEEAAR